MAIHFQEKTVSAKTVSDNRWLLPVIVALAFILRCVRLGTFSFWHDEVHNLLCAEFLWDLVTEGHLASNHPPLPYILLAGWRALGLGNSEWALRLLPVLIGTATVWAIYHLAVTLFDRRTGLIAALLLALSPFHVLHSQDLKEYIFLPLVVLIMGACLYRAVASGGKWWDWLGYGMLAGIGCYTEIFVGPLLVALNIWAMAYLGKNRRQWVYWFAANILGAALFLPWLAIMLQKAYATMVESTSWWIHAPDFWAVLFYFKTIAYGYAAGKPWFYLATLVFAVLLVLGLAAGLRNRSREVFFLAGWFFLPVTIIYIISHITQSIFLMRAMLPYAMGAYLTIALGITAIRSLRFRYGVLAGVLLLSGMGLIQYYERDYPPLEFPHRPGIHGPEPFEQAAAYILQHWQEEDRVLHGSQFSWLPFLWYGLREKKQLLAGGDNGFITYFHEANPANTPNPLMKTYFPKPVQELAEACSGRIWYVYGDWEREHLMGNSTTVWYWLDSHYTEIDRQNFGDIQLRLYTASDTTPVKARLWDDGAQAALLQGDSDAPYLWEGPNNGLVSRTVEERRGRLRVDLEAINTADKAPFLVIANQSREEVSFGVEVIASDAMLDLAAVWRDKADVDSWKSLSYTPPDTISTAWPQHVLLGDAAFGSGAAHREWKVPAGNYHAWLSSYGPAPCVSAALAPISVAVNGVDVPFTPCDEASAMPQWMYLPAASLIAVEGDRGLTVNVGIEPLSDKTPGYALLNALYLLRAETVADAPSSPPHIQETHTVAAGDTLSIPLAALCQGRSRMDAWVYDTGPVKKAYHVFYTTTEGAQGR